MEKIDYSRFHEKFNNAPVRVGDPQSEIDMKRDAFIKANALTYNLQPAVPDNIPGRIT